MNMRARKLLFPALLGLSIAVAAPAEAQVEECLPENVRYTAEGAWGALTQEAFLRYRSASPEEQVKMRYSGTAVRYSTGQKVCVGGAWPAEDAVRVLGGYGQLRYWVPRSALRGDG
jgi:hypothetical protein